MLESVVSNLPNVVIGTILLWDTVLQIGLPVSGFLPNIVRSDSVFKKTIFGFGISLAISGFACAQMGGTVQNTDNVPIGIDYTDTQNSCGGVCSTGDCYGDDSCRTDCDLLQRCPYVSVFGGWNGMQRFEQSDIGANTANANSGGFHDGTIAGFAIGTQVHPQVRYELETSWRSNDSDQWVIEQFANGVVTSRVTAPATGQLSAISGMVNLLVDIQPRKVNCWNMYAGGGIGAVSVDGTIVSTDTYDVNDKSLAFQGILGVNRAVQRRVDLYGEYRYFSARSVSVDNTTSGLSLGDFDYSTNNLLFGVRFRR